ncbi:MAG: hypothetical protein ACOH5I_16560 [Oligoflexus sp.]
MTAKMLLITAAIFFFTSSDHLHAQAQRLHSGDQDISILGYGLDSQQNVLRQACISGIPILHRNEMMELRVYQTADFDEYFRRQMGSGSVGVDIWLIGAKAKQEFIQRNTETEQRMSMMWEIVYEYGSQSLEQRQLSLIGLDAINRDDNEKLRLCGDRFVHSVKLGAKVLLAASLHFPTKESYQQFKTKVTVSILGGLIKFSKEFLKEMSEHGAEAILSIQALQLGGDPIHLESFAAKGQRFCQIQELEECLATFHSLYHYMFAEDGFRQSLQGQNIEQLYPFYFTTELYRESDHELLAPAIKD